MLLYVSFDRENILENAIYLDLSVKIRTIVISKIVSWLRDTKRHT